MLTIGRQFEGFMYEHSGRSNLYVYYKSIAS